MPMGIQSTGNPPIQPILYSTEIVPGEGGKRRTPLMRPDGRLAGFAPDGGTPCRGDLILPVLAQPYRNRPLARQQLDIHRPGVTKVLI